MFGHQRTVQAFCGWLYGQFPPGLLANFKLAGSHLLNMFRAHAAAYKAIKELPGTFQLCHTEGTLASSDLWRAWTSLRLEAVVQQHIASWCFRTA